jgi:acyl-coenzyme A thioesterase PaaI-like protein
LTKLVDECYFRRSDLKVASLIILIFAVALFNYYLDREKTKTVNSMKEKVTSKQHNSSKCFVCGLNNKFGLKASFYELENNSIVAIFFPAEEHQSYPGRLHGGIAGTILDETLGRTIMLKEKNIWGVTVELSLKFKKPLPLDQEIKVFARIDSNSSRIFLASGEIKLPNGDIAVSATGKYFKMPLEKITQDENLIDNWKIAITDHDPTEIEI